MRCHICNAILKPEEIKPNPEHKDFDPCGACKQVINSLFNDNTEEEIDAEINQENGEGLYYEE